MDAFNKVKGETGRASLIANRWHKRFVKRLSDEGAWWLSLHEINDFLGLRQPPGYPKGLTAKMKQYKKDSIAYRKKRKENSNEKKKRQGQVL